MTTLKSLILVDTDITRSGWLGACLEARGFLLLGVADSLDTALNGITRCHPNVVLVAPKVGKLSGASVTRTIMESHPVPIVLLQDPRDSLVPVDNLWSGATSTTWLPEPPGSPEHIRQVEALAQKLSLMSEVPVIKRRSYSGTAKASSTQQVTEQKIARLSITPIADDRHAAPQHLPKPGSSIAPTLRAIKLNSPPTLIGIASSTGGPVVVQKILENLPANYPIPIVVVQHLTEGFCSTMINWLDSCLKLKVVEAHHGDICRPGYVYIVSRQMHAVIQQGLQIKMIAKSVYPGHCPSGTVFLNSMAALLGAQAMGIVLTGMGNDGSEGLLAIRNRGGVTFAQDESTCTIASMPHEAVSIGAASFVLTPEGIGTQLARLCQK